MNDFPLVSIICTSYNHELFIRDALEGFIMQKTSFPFEIIVCDDASTDSTASIIKQYEKQFPKLFKTFYHTENQYSKGIPFFTNELITSCVGKYIALCEGDDYWIDPFKLQKQFDFLEANQDFGMCYTRAKIYLQDKKKFSKIISSKYIDFKHTLVANPVVTLTTTFRRDLYIKYIEDILPTNHNWMMGDYPIWLWFSYNSKIKFFEDVTGVYRVLQCSASHSKEFNKALNFIESTQNIKNFFCDKYKVVLNKKFKKLIYENYLLPKFSLFLKFNSNIDQVYDEINTAQLYSWKFIIIRLSRYSSILRNFLSARWN